MKDEEIYFLRQKLSVLQKRMDDCRNLEEVKDVEFVISYEELFFFVEDDDGIKFIVVDEG